MIKNVLFMLIILLFSACSKNQTILEQKENKELELKKELESEQLGENPYQDYQVEGTFTGGEESKQVRGFYNGNQVFVVRLILQHNT